jgi:hypothetical protein
VKGSKQASKQASSAQLSFFLSVRSSVSVHTPFLQRGDGGGGGGGGGQCGIAKMAMIHRKILAKFGYKLNMK